MKHELLDQSCRVAFAALIHDIGKFAERAKIDMTPEQRNNNVHVFCPFNQTGERHTHIHAAYTAAAIDAIERQLPAIKGENIDTTPFQQGQVDDSVISAAAFHHKPGTYLQRVISVADRLSSAFERSEYAKYNERENKEDYLTSRLIPLFDKLSTDGNKRENLTAKDLLYRYPLKPLSPDAVFPQSKQTPTRQEATAEYEALWNAFVADLRLIHDRENWDLWLDHFDTLYSIYTQNIPSATAFGTMPDVPLYDHSKSTAALATALWRYHRETGTENVDALKNDDERKFLLIQGDVSGIQGFIFDAGKNTRKNAYKILRGRSFMVSLFSECAALKVLRGLGLPSTSQIMNAAGKFVIVAPNTPATFDTVEKIKEEINDWFLKRFYGQISLGLATVAATQRDFEQRNFKVLQSKIFESLGTAKLQKFDLCRRNAGVMTDFSEKFDDAKGVCCFDGKFPAEAPAAEDGDFACQTCLDILKTGEKLTKNANLVVSETPVGDGWESDIFGYYVGWKKSDGVLRRWDISLPQSADGAQFNGRARRYINAYVPRDENGQIKTFENLAKVNCYEKDGVQYVKPALMCVKGDIDNLGSLFQKGFDSPTFATMAGLSRQLNNFFTVFLPYLCQEDERAKNIYTVFAGGDDFYLIGPWLDMARVVPTLRERFRKYVCDRDDITFSIGMCMNKGDDAVTLSGMAEESLDKAKGYVKKDGEKIIQEKNAVTCFGQTVSFDDYKDLMEKESRLDELVQKYGLSIGYVYGLLSLCEMADKADKDFTAAAWRSKLVYKTARFVETSRKIQDEDKQNAAAEIAKEIGDAISNYKTDYKIALFTWLYQQREG